MSFGRSLIRIFEAITSNIHGLVGLKALIGYRTIYSEPLMIPSSTLLVEASTSKLENPQYNPSEPETIIVKDKHLVQGIWLGSTLPPLL